HNKSISFTERPPAVTQSFPVAGNHLGAVLLGWHGPCPPAFECPAGKALVAGMPDASFTLGRIEIYNFTSLNPHAVWTSVGLALDASVATGNQVGSALA